MTSKHVVYEVMRFGVFALLGTFAFWMASQASKARHLQQARVLKDLREWRKEVESAQLVHSDEYYRHIVEYHQVAPIRTESDLLKITEMIQSTVKEARRDSFNRYMEQLKALNPEMVFPNGD